MGLPDVLPSNPLNLETPETLERRSALPSSNEGGYSGIGLYLSVGSPEAF
jgi:hypothetical protein